MTEKQKRFCDEYLIDLNATRAYKVVYTKIKNDATAAAAASRMLKNVNVAAHIAEKQQIRQQRTEITQDRVIAELAKIGFADVTDFVEITGKGISSMVTIKPTAEIAADKTGAIAGIKEGANGIEVKLNDKLRALELIGRHVGMFAAKSETDSSGEGCLTDLIKGLTDE